MPACKHLSASPVITCAVIAIIEMCNVKMEGAQRGGGRLPAHDCGANRKHRNFAPAAAHGAWDEARRPVVLSGMQIHEAQFALWHMGKCGATPGFAVGQKPLILSCLRPVSGWGEQQRIPRIVPDADTRLNLKRFHWQPWHKKKFSARR
jgi:hypothetical protein